jgi:hypothetical protein
MQDMEDQVLQCMFYLCRISRKRQEKAATAGLVPYLQRYSIYSLFRHSVAIFHSIITSWRTELHNDSEALYKTVLAALSQACSL